MLAALLLLAILGREHPAGPAAALLVGAVVCCAAAMGGDNLQDLKPDTWLVRRRGSNR